MSFCKNCGNEIEDGAMFCTKCGQPVNNTTANNQPNNQNTQQNAYQQPTGAPVYQNYQQPMPNLITQLSSKIKTEAIVWTVIACLQVIIGLYNLYIGFSLNSYYYDGTTNIVSGVIVLIVAVINFTVSAKDFKYAKEIFARPIGIVKKYQPIGGLIGTLIYNLLFGGIIGVVGSIFGFVTRSFVMNNALAFQNIEMQFSGTVQQ